MAASALALAAMLAGWTARLNSAGPMVSPLAPMSAGNAMRPDAQLGRLLATYFRPSAMFCVMRLVSVINAARLTLLRALGISRDKRSSTRLASLGDGRARAPIPTTRALRGHQPRFPWLSQHQFAEACSTPPRATETRDGANKAFVANPRNISPTLLCLRSHSSLGKAASLAPHNQGRTSAGTRP